MISTEQLLSAADQLPDDQLQALAQQVARLAARRRSSALTPSESDLLRRINLEPNAQRVARYHELRARRLSDSLNEAEARELLELSDWLEEMHAERLRAVAELAQARGLSLDEMMQRLGVRHLINGAS